MTTRISGVWIATLAVLGAIGMLAGNAGAQERMQPGTAQERPAQGDDLGPFHRQQPPDGAADSRPTFADAIEAIGYAIGIEGEQLNAFKAVMVRADQQTKTVQAEADRLAQEVRDAQGPALQKALPAEKFEKLQRVMALVNRYKNALADLHRQAAENPEAARRIRQQANEINRTVDREFQRILGEENAAGFIRLWHAVRYREMQDADYPEAARVLADALELTGDTRTAFTEIIVGNRRKESRIRHAAEQKISEIRQRQRTMLAELLRPEMLEKVSLMFRIIESYKAARAELEQAAKQPTVRPADIEAQGVRIDEATEAMLREIVLADRYERFVELWYRIVRDGLRDR